MAAKYLLVLVTFSIISYLLLFIAENYFDSATILLKVCIDILLFIIIFILSREFIYKNEDSNSKPNNYTNWEKYYEKRSIFSKLSGKIAAKKLISLFNKYNINKPQFIAELGGGNSIVYSSLRNNFPDCEIALFDRVDFTEQSFVELSLPDQHLQTIQIDLLDDLPGCHKNIADNVFSLGLIEHFQPTETAKMIKQHFNIVKKNGLVLISFPTPTLTYNLIRNCMELLGVWSFHDERALTFDEVNLIAKQYGELITKKIDFRLGLTQGILIYKSN